MGARIGITKIEEPPFSRPIAERREFGVRPTRRLAAASRLTRAQQEVESPSALAFEWLGHAHAKRDDHDAGFLLAGGSREE